MHFINKSRLCGVPCPRLTTFSKCYFLTIIHDDYVITENSKWCHKSKMAYFLLKFLVEETFMDD